MSLYSESVSGWELPGGCLGTLLSLVRLSKQLGGTRMERTLRVWFFSSLSSLYKYFGNISLAPGIVLGAGDTVVKKTNTCCVHILAC